ncbi:KdelR [Symbiodinium sp. CCMP2456]|nr:KdelR [Symbiodinium sp. CCMP2456]
MSADPGGDVHDAGPQDPWSDQDPWAQWRTDVTEPQNSSDTTTTTEQSATEPSNDQSNGATDYISGWGDNSSPGNGVSGAQGRRWSDEAWQQWLRGTWRPDFGGAAEHPRDERRTSDASANSNGATGATGSSGAIGRWWDNYTNDWDRGPWRWSHGSWGGWTPAAGAASASTTTPTDSSTTRPGSSSSARPSTTSTDGRTAPGVESGGSGKGPSEKLIIPSFNGEGEGGELGTSARSYLRQIDAWERMTKLHPSQRALVLYQHLEGAAWINAEALNMERLSASDGVAYLRGWVQQHYLDVEVTSVGRSLSDLFRKLKRRYNQSFRDYTAEFNRLLARVVECGCRLPDVATAWLYVDRASLDEATEVSLLASVGNKYQLLQLQQAAIILDRSMRKPWERNAKQDGPRKPQTVHHTEDAEHPVDENSDDEPPSEDVAGEDGEQLYIAYMTAKARYKDTTKARGVDIEAVKKTAEERIKAAKARSYCSVCHQKGHWHRDACCPKRKAEIHTVNVAHEIDSLSPGHTSGLLAITDSACSKSVVGTVWLQAYLNMVRNQGKAAELIPEREAFRFGASRVYESTYSTIIMFHLGKSWVAVKASVIHGDIPLLLSKPALAKLGMILDLEKNTADFRKLGIKDLQLLTTPSGHPAVPVCHKGKSPPDPSTLPKAWGADGTVILAEPAEVYMIAVTGDGLGDEVEGGDRPGFHRIFYEKKAAIQPFGLAAASSIETNLAIFASLPLGMSSESLPTWKMNKTQLLAECHRRSLAVSTKWTMTELRHVLAGDDKHYHYRGSKPEGPKSISKMSRDELVEEAEKLGILVGAKETRGSLMLKIRDHTAPDDTVMTIGRFRGESYVNIPQSYAEWASEEEKINGDNMHPELKRFVMWRRSQKTLGTPRSSKAGGKQRGYLDVEENAMIPPPPFSETGASASAWDVVERMSEHPAAAPKSSARSTRRPLEDDLGTRRMEKDAEPHVMEEIRALEERLACLKAVHEEIGKDIYPEDAAEGNHSSRTIREEIGKDIYPEDTAEGDHSVRTIHEEIREDIYPEDTAEGNHSTQEAIQEEIDKCPLKDREANSNSAGDGFESCGSSTPSLGHEVLYTKEESQSYLDHTVYSGTKLDPGEEMACRALRERRFSNKDLEDILNACEFPDNKKRPGVHGEGEGHRCVLGYYAFGKFHGITRQTGERSNLTKYVNQFLLRNGCDPTAAWTSLSITYNAPATIHTDKNNLPGSENVVWTGGDHRGGGLWVAQSNGTNYRRDANGEAVPGHIIETKNKVTKFDPKRKHASEPWCGERWSVVGYVARSLPYASKTSRKLLTQLGFPVPTAANMKDFRNNNLAKAAPSITSTRPRRTAQRGLWRNIATVFSLMTTTLAAMDLCVREHVEPRTRPRVAMLEIGGVEATCYATGVCADTIDVAEPLFYEDLQWAERVESCGFGPIETAMIRREPAELWLHVSQAWTHPEIKADAESAISRQLHEGRRVVLQREQGEQALWTEATAGWEEAGYAVDYDIDHYGHEYIRIDPHGHSDNEIHTNYVAEDGQGPSRAAAPDKDGARSIRFPASVPRHIAASLRRLHQNLGHPSSSDFVRHLRLAGASREVLKAARTLECQTCARTRATAIAKPAKIGSCLQFNEVVGADLFYVHDTEGNRHEMFSIVDYSSAYHVVIPVARKDTTHLEKAFCENWANVFGAPCVVTVDLENGLQKALARIGDWTGTRIKSAAGQAHWQAGFTERQGGIWKAVFARINEEMSVTKGDIHLAASAVSSAKNNLTRANGYSPQQHVFGATPRLPEDLLEGPHARDIGDEAIIDDKHAREVALRTSARAAYHHVQTDERVRRALAGRARVQARRPAMGEQVYYFRRTKNAKRGVWMGPGTVIGEEGTNLWIAKGGRCVLCAEEHVRLATPEELGHAFSLRVAREDLEKLLGADPEDEEIYDLREDADEEALPDMDLDDDDWADIVPSEPEEVGYDMDEDEEHRRGNRRSLEGLPMPGLRRKRHKGPPEPSGAAAPPNEVNMLKKAKTERSRAKQLEKEIPWSQIRDEVRPLFIEAERKQWAEHIQHNALEVLDVAASEKIRASVPRERILSSRYAYTATKPWGNAKPAPARRGGRKRDWLWEDILTPIWGVDPLEVLTEETFMIEGKAHRLRPCPLDPCVFLLQSEDSDRPKAYVGIHVDDLLVVAHEKYRLALQERISELFPVDSWEEEEFDYIGSRVIKKDDVVKVNQSAFVEGRLFSIEVPKDQDGNQPASEEQRIDNKSLIGALSWLSSQSRPDLQCSVALSQQLQQSPTADDIRFTNATATRAMNHRDKGLTLHPINLERAVVVVYHDAGWANAEHEDAEPDFQLTEEEKRNGMIGGGLYTEERPRQPKRARSKLASQLGHLVCLCDRGVAEGLRVPMSILEWRSQACKRVCRSTFGAETMSAIEALEAAQYLRSLLATLVTGKLTKHEEAITFCPILALTDCKSLHDYLRRAGQPRLPSDRRLAIDLAALRQDLHAEVPGEAKKQTALPMRWIPTAIQMADILTKPKKGDEWWAMWEEGIQLPFSPGTLNLRKGGKIFESV